MIINYDEIVKQIIGEKLAKPQSGTLSGHAAGEPFDKFVYKAIKDIYPNNTFRNFEYLNYLYIKNPQATDYQSRINLLGSEVLSLLLSRGRQATINWTPDSQFVEKQNDTADIIFKNDSHFDIIDIKTRNMSIKGQAPNIISAYKLANAMKCMIDTNDFDKLDMVYIGIDWKLEGDHLVVKNTHVKSLFKTNPANLYINWAAAMQIQFHVQDLPQSYKFSKEQWAREYLTNFYHQAIKRANDMKKRFADYFEDYILD
ncbi:MAG TPA: HincII family type II restriction endonuclease [Gallicola sp.]|nr:HincII family type II restriction endonuclease [Gallicola sp.]